MRKVFSIITAALMVFSLYLSIFAAGNEPDTYDLGEIPGHYNSFSALVRAIKKMKAADDATGNDPYWRPTHEFWREEEFTLWSDYLYDEESRFFVPDSFSGAFSYLEIGYSFPYRGVIIHYPQSNSKSTLDFMFFFDAEQGNNVLADGISKADSVKEVNGRTVYSYMDYLFRAYVWEQDGVVLKLVDTGDSTVADDFELCSAASYRLSEFIEVFGEDSDEETVTVSVPLEGKVCCEE